MATGINISKANAYTVISPPIGIGVSKAIVYTVVEIVQTYSQTMAGGLVGGGTTSDTIVRSIIPVPSGGAVAGGSATITTLQLQVYHQTMSGGLVAGGSSLYNPITLRSYSQTMSGGLIAGGKALNYTQRLPVSIPIDDLGKAYALCFGHAKKVPCRYVSADFPNDYYDYIIGPGPIESVDVVYRDMWVVNPAEYTVYLGTQGSPYAGYAFLRFSPLEQRSDSGQLMQIMADVKGLKLGGSVSNRNFATVIYNILANTTWGLGLTVNSASFTTAASDVSDLYCDGYLADQQTAQDVLNDLLFICRGKLDKNEAGEWVISIDKAVTTPSGTFGTEDIYGYNNIVKINNFYKTPTSEAIKNIEFNYRFNTWQDKFILKNKRNIFAFGEDSVIENRYVRNSTTADKVTCYVQKLMQLGDEKLEIEVGMEGRLLQVRNTINVVIPRFTINGVYQIRKIEKNLSSFILYLAKYDASIYTYVIGNLPTDELNDDLPDFSETPPGNPLNFTKTTSGTSLGSDGTIYSYVELSVQEPPINFNKMLFGYTTVDGTSFTISQGTDTQINTTWTCRIEGLAPKTAYNFVAYSENIYGKRSSGLFLTESGSEDIIAAEDTTAPAIPTGLVSEANISTITLDWNDNTETDLKWYEIYRDTVPGGMGTESTITLLTDEDYVKGAVIDTENGYAYFGVGMGGSTAPSTGKIKKVDLTSGTITSTLILSIIGTPTSPVIDTVNGYMYWLVDTYTPNTLKIVKIRISTFSEVASIEVSDAYYSFSEQGIIDEINGFAYWGINTSTPTIIKLNLSTFTLETPLTLDASDDSPRSAIIDTYYGYAYFGMDMTPGRIVQIKLSDFTRNAVLNFASGENGNKTACFDPVNKCGYFALGGSKVIKISTYTFIKVGSTVTLTGLTGSGGIVGCMIDIGNGFAYFFNNEDTSNYVLCAQVRLSDFTEVGLYTGNIGDLGQTNIIDEDAQYAYIGVSDTPGVIYRTDLLPGA